MAKPTKKKSDSSTSPKPVSHWGILALFALVVMILYAPSLRYDFTLDDDLFVRNHPAVQKGLGGIPEAFNQGSTSHFKGSNFEIYRPWLLTAFCIQKAFFGFKPAGYHFVNVMLYIGLAIVLFNLLRRLFPDLHPQYPAFITLLFLVHPIHTEVVANVKSQDELWAALFNLGALSLFVHALREPSQEMRHLGLATLLYLGGLFSKESSVAFLVIFPLTYLLVKPDSLIRALKLLSPLAFAAGLFLVARHLALQGVEQENETTILENVLYGAGDTGTLWATKAAILWHFIKLMFIPYPLSWDYSFNQIPLQTWSDAVPWISVLSFASLSVLALMHVRKTPGISFGLLFFLVLISPTANILFFNGTTFADRFLFLPSGGFLLAACILFLKTSGHKADLPPRSVSKTFLPVGITLLLVFGGMSMNRAGDWKNNLAVFKSGAENAPNSSRTNLGLATEYMNIAERQTDFRMRNAYVDSAIIHFEKSLAIYPDNYAASYRLGLIYSMQNRNDRAIALYRQSLRAKADNLLALNNLGALYASANRLDSALWCFEESIKLDSLNNLTLTNLVIVNNLLGRSEDALRIGEKAIAAGQGSEKTYRILEGIYRSRGDLNRASQMQTLLSTGNGQTR